LKRSDNQKERWLYAGSETMLPNGKKQAAKRLINT
jgi:hypothetical protein